MFKRPHHQRIAFVLSALNGELLREHHCYFGGGTAIALRYGEYRESVDIDFMVSDLASYRNLRQLVTTEKGVLVLVRQSHQDSIMQTRDVRADQYGIRTSLQVADQLIKFEIVLEARIVFDSPKATDKICGVTTLTPLDMATSKLLANSDRWADDGVFNRDIIDLAMMKPALPLLNKAVSKAELAYGKAIKQDLHKALEKLKTRDGWLERCLQAMEMDLPKANLWQYLRVLTQGLK